MGAHNSQNTHNAEAVGERALGALAARGLLDGIGRIDLLGSYADDGDAATPGEIGLALYGRGLSDAQRAASGAVIAPGAWITFVDLERAEDMSYILWEREATQDVHGRDPVTLYG